jgi:mRNA interferase HigB
MRVISRKQLREFGESHADARDALYNWYRVASKATWQDLLEVQQFYPKAEA